MLTLSVLQGHRALFHQPLLFQEVPRQACGGGLCFLPGSFWLFCSFRCLPSLFPCQFSARSLRCRLYAGQVPCQGRSALPFFQTSRALPCHSFPTHISSFSQSLLPSPGHFPLRLSARQILSLPRLFHREEQ